MDKITASETIKRLNSKIFVTASKGGAFEYEVTRNINQQLEACLGYPAPFRIRLVLDRDDIGKITDVEITPTRAIATRMHPTFARQIRDGIAQALKSLGTIYMTGIYTGEDGSMGFRRGQTYRFALIKAPGRRHEVKLRTEEGLLCCPYSSIDALLRYWHPLYLWGSESDNVAYKRTAGGATNGKR